jgi:hypothetical protein
MYKIVDNFTLFIRFNAISCLYHILNSYTITLHCIKDFYTCKGEGVPSDHVEPILFLYTKQPEDGLIKVETW